MRTYLLRRLLLIPPTLLGVTLLVFFVTRIVPGGPLERALMERAAASEGSRGSQGSGQAISESQRQQLAAYYGFDKPFLPAYVEWLGKVLRGDLGDSYRFGEPVGSLILSRLPVSLTYGAVTLLFVFGICIPLGVAKALQHRTGFDNATSALVFFGYAIPGYALGAILVVYLAARLEWFPMGGFVSDAWYDKGFWARLLDWAHHAVLPITCYIVGAFAFLTMLVKNNLLDNLAADFVRTAVAKGVTFRTAVFHHALRNSLIPLATYFGASLGALVGGSFIIETIFDINGMGLLGYTSVVDRDYPTVMGVLLVSSLVLLLGNIVGDVLAALADPRIRFK